ncbi:MAG: YggS family pyridoxal phosphate-dependent enzyme [Gemmatimonadales bacterium]|nr:MAG: YggS family pyridoxal phosphate-dependent enzyme [Gemmatimonadales bacterium]
MYEHIIAETLPDIRERLDAAAVRSGRRAGEVQIVAVTKGHSAAALRAVLDAGLYNLGENRVEELERKQDELQDDDRPRWHMVGHVQSRKAPQLWGRVNLLHSLDSSKLGARFHRTRPEGAEPIPVLVQVNTSGEDAKYGFTPEGFTQALPGLVELTGLQVRGLMTMAPFTDDEEWVRTTFRRLRETHEWARANCPGYEGTELSMGMSNDFEIAVEEGSTMIRLGSALLGERPT